MSNEKPRLKRTINLNTIGLVMSPIDISVKDSNEKINIDDNLLLIISKSNNYEDPKLWYFLNHLDVIPYIVTAYHIEKEEFLIIAKDLFCSTSLEGEFYKHQRVRTDGETFGDHIEGILLSKKILSDNIPLTMYLALKETYMKINGESYYKMSIDDFQKECIEEYKNSKR